MQIDAQFQTPKNICELMADKIPEGTLTVLEPTPGKGNLVSALRGYDVTAPSNFFDVEGIFDAIVMNPPFTPMKLGYEILYKCMDMTDVIIALMPWLTIINSQKRTEDIFKYGLKEVTHLPRNTFKGSRVQTCILEMRRGYKGVCVFSAI